MTQVARAALALSLVALLSLPAVSTRGAAQSGDGKTAPKTSAKPAGKPAGKPAATKPTSVKTAPKPSAKQARGKKQGESTTGARPKTPAKPQKSAVSKPTGPQRAAKPQVAKPQVAKPQAVATRPAALGRPAASPPPPAATAYSAAAEPERPTATVAAPSLGSTFSFGRLFNASTAGAEPEPTAAEPSEPPARSSAPLNYAPAAPVSEADAAATREAISLARSGKTDAATTRRDQIRDAAAQRLVEWIILRSDDNGISFPRYAAFIRANPSWPAIGMLRRRAEAQLWMDKREPGTVFAFFSDREPISGRGKLAMARAALAQGDRESAQRYVRSAWRNDGFSADMEGQVLETFGGMLNAADHKVRMHVHMYSDDLDIAMRAAKRLGAAEVAIVNARAAVNRKAANAGALLGAVPSSAHSDPSFMFTKVQWLRRTKRLEEAAKLMLACPRDAAAIHDTDEWWSERRLLARAMLDEGQPQLAYRLARDAALPTKENPAVEQLFTAGWIALRFTNDTSAALRHFADIAKVTRHPTSLARRAYWMGRTAEAAGRGGEARQHYESAAAHSASYYGQLARARIGRHEIAVRRPPTLSNSQRAAVRGSDLVRSVELLYATGNRDLALAFVNNLDGVDDAGVLTAIADIAMAQSDARAVMSLGKYANARGHHFDHYAFPTIGIPKYSAIGADAGRGLVYAIARQESAFAPNAVSSARAMGLMQVTTGTGRLIAKRYGVKFDPKRMLSDPAYNVQLGSAELATLLRDYDGSHVLAFVGYNAGRGRAREWVARYGDPRDPKVDIVDWVERIPISETRNYVQRVMENAVVYGARFKDGARLTIEADMRGARQ